MNLKIPAIVIALLVLGSFADAKIEIDKITVTMSTSSSDLGDDSLSIDPGDDFYVHVKVKPSDTLDNADSTLKIYVDDTLVYSETVTMDLVEDEYYVLNVSSDNFDEGNYWEGNLMAYDCGDHTIKASLGGKDISGSKTDTASLEIDGDEYRVSISPDQPTLTDKITVTVKDEDKDEVEGATVKFTKLGDSDTWDDDYKTADDETDSDGEVTFKLSSEFGSSAYGKYQIDVYNKDEGYCKYTKIIDTRVSLVLSGTDPAYPTTGQQIRMRVTDQNGNAVAGAKVILSRAGAVNTYTTDAQGYVTYTVNSSGSFDAVASKSGYTDSLTVTVTVSDKSSLIVALSPEKDVAVGSEVQITVTGSDGKPVKGAKVSVIQSDGTTEEFSTPDNGKITYRPQSAGQYKVKAEAAMYSAATKDFKAYSIFTVNLPETPSPKEEIIVEVLDAGGKPVNGASILVKEAGVSGTTDLSGKYSFTVPEPGEYTISVKKDNYMEYSKNLTIQGVLSLEISDKEVSLGDTVGIIVQDSQGNKVNAKIVVTKPSGEEETLTTEEYKPSEAGTHTVSASKDGYQTATGEFNVKALPLVIKAKMEGQKIVATATSDGNPVPEIAVIFEGAGLGKEEALTDKNGKAILDTAKSNVSGNVTISSKEPNYEQASTTIEVKPVAGTDSSMLLMILIALIVVIIAIIAVTTKGGKKKKEKGMLYRTAGGRSHLEG